MNPRILSSIFHLRIVELPSFRRDDGSLVVMETGQAVPFEIARVFTVHGERGAIRGEHAHKACSQFMTATSGTISVSCEDGRESVAHKLDRPDRALLVPPGIWCSMNYHDAGSVLTVLCDRPFEADDYIRDHAEFLSYRTTSG